jgi:hypothetical protein
MSKDAEAIDGAFNNLHHRKEFRFADRQLTVVCLIREADWRPLKAPWWRKTEACIIGADLNGNFFLRHCDGSVRYWDHSTQSDTVVAASVVEFCSELAAPSAS